MHTTKQIIWVLWDKRLSYNNSQLVHTFLKSQFHFQRKYCLLSGPNDVQFHFPNSWILTLRCRTTMMKMVIPPTKYQLLPTRLCWLITFKLEGSIVIQLRVVVLVFPPHPHIHPLVSRNVIKWMTKTWGCCRIVHSAKDQKTERNDKKSIGKMRVRAKSLLSLVLPIKKWRGNRKFFLKECHRYVWI